MATDHFPPHRSGHATAVAWWADALVEAGHRVTVLADTPPQPNAPYRVIPTARFPMLPYGHPAAALLPNESVLAALRATPPDIIHLHGYGPIPRQVLRAFHGTPSVLSIHAFPDGAGAPRIPGAQPLLRSLLSTLLRRVDAVTAPSRHAVARLKADWHTAAQTVPTGVAVAVSAAGPRPPAATTRHRFLFLGRLSVEKNFPQFARLAAQHPGAEWRAAGTGPLSGSGPVRFLGQLNHNEVIAELLQADALLSPSLVETQGLAVLEALTLGTAVAVPAGSAQAEMVRDDTWHYQPRHDDDALRALLAAAAATRTGAVSPPERLLRPALVDALLNVFQEASARRFAPSVS
jgi:glycosyltransferase involved in cell wall biosynthesis